MFAPVVISVIDLPNMAMLPGTPDLDALGAMAKAAHKAPSDWQRALGAITRSRNLGVVEKASVTVSLLDAQVSEPASE